MKTLKVYGPPGTGKTTFLLDLFERELKKVDAKKIAFATFTRAARLEALQRSGKNEDELPFLRTIHSICYRALGVSQGQIVKAKDLRYFGKQLGIKLSGTVPDPWRSAEDLGEFSFEGPTKDDQLLNINHLGRHRRQTLKEALRSAPEDLDFHYAKWFTTAYRSWKTNEGLVDYTDLLTEYLRVGSPLDVDVFFVDEAQDLSRLQWDVVAKLSANAERVYVAGDDDQAIFNWAGASAALFNAYPSNETKVLERSRRVPRAVQRVAQRVIERVPVANRLEKFWKARDAEGEYRDVGYLSAALFDAPMTYVLFRNHFRGRALAAQLQEEAVAYLGSSSPLSNEDVVTALEGWAKLARSESVSSREAFALVHATSPRLYAPGALAASQSVGREIKWDALFLERPKLDAFNATLTRLEGVAYLDRVARLRGFDSLLKPRVALLSIHQSKGREAHTVVVDRSLARRTYDAQFRAPDDEHRVWYVAVTRARERLFSLTSSDAMSYDL